MTRKVRSPARRHDRPAVGTSSAVTSPEVDDPGAVQEGGYGPGAFSCHPLQEVDVPDVEAHITGTVWKIECQVGDTIEEGDTVVILESMKMEMPVEAEDAGTVKEILCEEGQAVNEGDTLVVLE
jgi:acetyl-CoA carboxylase biotin carboxyl carrier protein